MLRWITIHSSTYDTFITQHGVCIPASAGMCLTIHPDWFSEWLIIISYKTKKFTSNHNFQSHRKCRLMSETNIYSCGKLLWHRNVKLIHWYYKYLKLCVEYFVKGQEGYRTFTNKYSHATINPDRIIITCIYLKYFL